MTCIDCRTELADGNEGARCASCLDDHEAQAVALTPIERRRLLTKAVATQLCTRGRELILDGYRVDSCILSTRVAVEYLRYHGVLAKPVAVKVDVFNAAAWDIATRGGDVDDFPYDEWRERNAHMLSIDENAEPRVDQLGRPGWNGHLVALVPMSGETWMLDLSADQFDRPAKNLHVAPMFVGPVDDWPFALVNDSGERIIYRRIENVRWKSSPDWTKRDRWAPIVAQLVREANV